MGSIINRIRTKKQSLLYAHPVLQGAYNRKRGWITGPFRMLPDFIIIGSQKCGTTSLYDFIVRHPAIKEARTKEIQYFAFNSEWPKFKFGPDYPVAKRDKFGVNWYRSNFPTKFEAWAYYRKTNQKMLTGEASTMYLHYLGVPNKVKNLLPEIKMIVILRNPTDRAYSAYNYYKWYYLEDRTFEDAIKQDLEGTETRYIRTYLKLGHYAQHLERWFKYFGRNQFLILTNEELREDLQGTLDKVWEFLDVVPYRFERQPENLNVGNYKPMSKKMRECLIEYYRPHNERLARLLWPHLDWNR